MTDKLMPCPFCESENILILEQGDEWYTAHCEGCGADGPYWQSDDSTLPSEAAEMWNTRTTHPALAAVISAWENFKDNENTIWQNGKDGEKLARKKMDQAIRQLDALMGE